MVAMYGLPIICPPYDLHVKPHLIPLVLPLSQVLMNQHLRNNNNKLKKKTLALNINKIRAGVRPFDLDTTIPLIFFCTRPKPAYGRQGLDWIVGPGYSFVVLSQPDFGSKRGN